jgi:hypothetical protein
MKTQILLATALGALLGLGAEAPPVRPPPPPPTAAHPPTPPPGTPAVLEARPVYQQTPVAARPVLVAPEQARAAIDKFRAALPKLDNPRILIYVNRELVDEQAGMKLAARSERTEATRTQLDSDFKPDPAAPKPTNQTGNTTTISPGGNVTIVGGLHSGDGMLTPGKGKLAVQSDKVAHENTYRFQERQTGALADKQAVRDLERWFGRPLRMAGAALADQRVATQMLGDNPLKTFETRAEGDQARRDRAALTNIADVVIEVLISSRNLTVTEVSGDKTYAVPDLQATAIRLKDARVLGQVTAADLIGVDAGASRVARSFGLGEIAEATALALMEDMLLGVAP